MLVALALAVPARAQDPEVPPVEAVPAETPADPTPEPAPRAVFPASFATGFWWVEAGPRSVTSFSDVTLHPERADVWAAVATDGGVWVTVDDGATWLEVLGPQAPEGGRDEELLGDAQARVEELAGDVDVPDPDDFVDGGVIDMNALEGAVQDSVQAARDRAADAVATVQSELHAGVGVDAAEVVETRPRVGFTRDGLLVVARADGLRVSEDLGGTWVLVLEEPVTALAELEDGRFVAGTPAGLRVSPTLARWTPLAALGQVIVVDLVVDGGLYVATDAGIWFSADLVLWRQLGAWVDEVLTVRPVVPPSDAEPRPLVLGADDDVWLARDPVGSPANGVFGGPIPVARSIVRRDPDGLLVAASAAGPFESTDGGSSWTAIRRGLPDGVEVQDVELKGDRVVLASGGGLWELAPVPPGLDRAPLDLEPWIPLPVLVDAAQLRRELKGGLGSRWLANAVPVVQLWGSWGQSVGDDWDADSWTIRSVDTAWAVEVQLTWRKKWLVNSEEFVDADALADALQAMVVDGEVVLLDGDVSPDVLAGTVRRSATVYRNELATTVSGLWTARQRLALESTLRRDAPLAERVQQALRLAELEARIDVLTDGAVSAWDPTGTEEER